MAVYGSEDSTFGDVGNEVRVFAKPVPPYASQPYARATSQNGIKVATSNLFIIDEASIPVDLMTDLIFQDIGGQEIINIENTSTVNSKDYTYSVITNVEDVGNNFDPQELLNVQDTNIRRYETFAINLATHIPKLYDDGLGNLIFDDPNDTTIAYEHVSLEQGSNDLVIWIIDLQENERVEVEFMTYYSKLNDTMYI